MDWTEEYKKKLCAAEEAVKLVKSGDRVMVSPLGDHPKLLPGALAARRGELKGVEALTSASSIHPGAIPSRINAWPRA